MLLLPSYDFFFFNYLFHNILSGTLSVSKSLDPDLGLTWVQTGFKGYQLTTKVTTGKESDLQEFTHRG